MLLTIITLLLSFVVAGIQFLLDWDDSKPQHLRLRKILAGALVLSVAVAAADTYRHFREAARKERFDQDESNRKDSEIRALRGDVHSLRQMNEIAQRSLIEALSQQDFVLKNIARSGEIIKLRVDPASLLKDRQIDIFSTGIEPSKVAQRIVNLLAEHGVRQVSQGSADVLNPKARDQLIEAGGGIYYMDYGDYDRATAIAKLVMNRYPKFFLPVQRRGFEWARPDRIIIYVTVGRFVVQ